jgi:predicted GTPase
MNASTPASNRTRIVILGAAGRDFHNFNTVYRDDASVEVVAFTAAQIPNIAKRRYPPELAGALYPEGIAIRDECELEALCRQFRVERVVFAYSDVTHAHVMHLASRALSAGADFVLLGAQRTMLRSKLPVIAVSAVRTGCGKSQIARWLSRHLRRLGKRVAVLRHPMPYGDLVQQRVQRFASRADLDAAHCTAEEREEYEPHLVFGNVVFAGVDYQAILRLAEAEADVIVWDGGNNDFPFLKPDLHIVVADALRPAQIDTHHPGEAVARMADVIVINKVNAASPATAQEVHDRVRAINERAMIVRAASQVHLGDGQVRGKRVLVVEDGPSITHGGMAFGAGFAASMQGKAKEVIDPRSSATPDLLRVFEDYPHIGKVLPAMGYGEAQLRSLAETINRAQADVVVTGTPIDLAALIQIDKPVLRARYEFADAGEPTLASVIDVFLARSQ